MPDCLITIIVPVRNNRLTIARCLGALALQDYPHFEVIIVDNNSTDGILKHIRHFLADRRFVYLTEKKIGRGAARQAGVEASRGDIIAMIDADCVPDKDWISNITRPVISKKEKIVMGAIVESSKNYWSRMAYGNDVDFINRQLTDDGRYVNHLATANFAIDGNLLRHIKFDTSLAYLEDFDLFLRLSRDYKIRFLKDVSVAHCRTNNFRKETATQFWRAYWMVRIYRKNKPVGLKNCSMFDSLSMVNWVTFPLWFLLKILSLPIHVLPFFVITQLSWRAGIVCGAAHL